MDEFLTTQQVAELLGVHRTTVLRLVEEGKIEARVMRYGQRPTIRITRSAVAAFLDCWVDQPADRGDQRQP